MNKTTVLLAFTSVLCFSSLIVGADESTPCYELRIYHAAPGKLDALNARFRDHTIRIFNHHHMKSIGYWMPVDNSENLLIYLLEHPSREAAEKAWKDFGADPDWRKVARESEANGRLVTRVEREDQALEIAEAAPVRVEDLYRATRQTRCPARPVSRPHLRIVQEARNQKLRILAPHARSKGRGRYAHLYDHP